MAEVLVAGVAVADIVMQVGDLPRRAEKYRATDAALTVGGCAANAATAIARHGGTARLAARLGRDPMGDLIVSALEAEGVDLSLSDRRRGARTSFSSVYVDRSGERQIMNFRGSGLAETLDLAAARRPDVVLTDNRWPQLTAAAIAAARGWGVPAIVDAEAPFEADAIRGATHIAFSMQGLAAYAPEDPIEQALHRARATFDAWIAVTDGPHGVWFTEGDTIGHVPAVAVEAVDTLGAGDIWHGAFALRLAEGADERTSIRFANAAAALKCRTFGGVASCPHRAETETFLKENA
jgi:sulfofructose kinase